VNDVDGVALCVCDRLWVTVVVAEGVRDCVAVRVCVSDDVWVCVCDEVSVELRVFVCD